ncbi:MAG: aminotransferase class V-fold PLP-dependent enzyme [Acidobacteriota bacterium]
MPKQPTRRAFLQTTTAAAIAGATAGSTFAGSDLSAKRSPSIYEQKLGLKPVINGLGTVTVLGGSIMPPEVVEAMVEASRYFIPLPELQRRVGARLAELFKVPAAMVTDGAASGIAVAAAVCIAGADREKIRQLPDTTGLKNEIIQQKSHHSGYEAQMEIAGARIIQVETRDELEKAINDRTAMLFFLNKADPHGQIKRAEWIRIGKQRGVPTFNDAAADVPPKERLRQYVSEGFDLVTFSGGKGLQGPQGSGLLLGRKDLIEAGHYAISPHGGVGRAMKVGKEEIMGLLAAVERYLTVDHKAERKVLQDRVDDIINALSGVRGLKASVHVPEIANEVPHVLLEWSEQEVKLTSQDVHSRLSEGDPPIMVSVTGEGQIRISVWMMHGNEHRVVADRLKEIFL